MDVRLFHPPFFFFSFLFFFFLKKKKRFFSIPFLSLIEGEALGSTPDGRLHAQSGFGPPHTATVTPATEGHTTGRFLNSRGGSGIGRGGGRAVVGGPRDRGITGGEAKAQGRRKGGGGTLVQGRMGRLHGLLHGAGADGADGTDGTGDGLGRGLRPRGRGRVGTDGG